MISRTLKGIVHVLGGLGAGLAIFLVLIAWRLSSGPISLSFLSPYIENALNRNQTSARIGLKDTILTWGGWQRTLDIRVTGVKITGSDNAVIAMVPELSISVSLDALAQGVLAAKNVDLIAPHVRVERGRDGTFKIGIGEKTKLSSGLLEKLAKQFLIQDDSSNAISYMTGINVVDADIVINDKALGKLWKSPKSQAVLRRTTGGMKGKASFDLVGEGPRSRVSIVGSYLTRESRGDINIDFKNIDPAVFSAISSDIEPLSVLDMPINGTVRMSIKADGKMQGAIFNINGGSGYLALPVPIAQRFGMLSLAQRIKVRNFKLAGSFKGNGGKTKVDMLSIDFAAASRVYIPAPVDHKMPIRSLAAKGSYIADSNRLEVTEFKVDLGGPQAKASAVVYGTAKDGIKINIKGVFSNITADSMAEYWPGSIGTDAREWSVAHLLDGRISKGNVEIKARIKPQKKGKTGTAPLKNFELLSVNGKMSLKGVTVDYLPPMPKATGIDAEVTFNRKRFDITASGGEAGGLKIKNGTVSLTGLDEYDQFADVRLSISGPVRDALGLIEHQPLGFASAIGIDPAGTGGNAVTDLKLYFIIEKTLSQEGVMVSASSKLDGVSVKNALPGQNIDNGRLTLEINNKGMDVSGRINIGNIPADLVWRKNFTSNAPFRDRYDISGSIADVGSLLGLGIDPGFVSKRFINGALKVKARFTVQNKTAGRLDIDADLSEAALSVPMLRWRKKSGLPGKAAISLDIKGNLISRIPSFSISTDDLQVDGSAIYSKAGSGLESVKLNKLHLNGTDMSMLLVPDDDGNWTVKLKGSGFNLEPFFDDIFKDEPTIGDDNGTRLRISAKLDRVRLGPGRFLKNVTGSFVRNGDRWVKILATGKSGNDKSFKLTLRPAGGGKRKLLVSAGDAGEILRAFDFYQNMSGGTLKLSGTFNDNLANSPLEGRLDIRDYRVVKATALAQLVSYLSLTGILEALQGDGLAFQSMKVPFVLSRGVLDITDARAVGISLGYTASGKIYTHAKVVDIGGTVVPAYAINSVLGNIPILGDILTGGEEGGGIFAANYKMTGSIEDPRVTVNPLSVLAPGFLRNLFKTFGKDQKPLAIP